MPPPLARIDSLMEEAVAARVFPCGVVCFGAVDNSRTLGMPPFLPHFCRAYGAPTFESGHVPVGGTSVFDVASLTKAMATTSAIMLLIERKVVNADAAVASYLPWFADNGKDGVTLRHCLEHTSGLRPCFSLWENGARGAQAARECLAAEVLRHAPGAGSPLYSDLGMIALGFVVEELSGERLDAFVRRRVFEPLGMHDTGFHALDIEPRCVADADAVGRAAWDDAAADGAWPLPPVASDSRVVPTEVDAIRGRLLWGEVHDPNAYLMGGVAGHAGLFTTARDTAKFAACLLNGGTCLSSGRRVFSEETVASFHGTSRAHFSAGWDTRERSRVTSRSGTPACGRRMGVMTFGHLGFTGCSLWIDPSIRAFVLLFANAVHPTSDVGSPGDRIIGLRPAIADAAMDALLALRRPPLPPRRYAALCLVPHSAQGRQGDRTHAIVPAPFTHSVEEAPEAAGGGFLGGLFARAPVLGRVAGAALDAGLVVAAFTATKAWFRRRFQNATRRWEEGTGMPPSSPARSSPQSSRDGGDDPPSPSQG